MQLKTVLNFNWVCNVHSPQEPVRRLAVIQAGFGLANKQSHTNGNMINEGAGVCPATWT